MDNLNELLSGLSPEDLSRLQAVAKNLLTKPQEPAPSAPQEKISLPEISSENASLLRALSSLSQIQNEENDVTRFLKSLQPLLSKERQQKIEEALRFLHVMDALPLLKGML